MEIYYLSFGDYFLEQFDYEWTLIANAIFIEFGYILIGVCNETETSLVLNPTGIELKEAELPKTMYVFAELK